MTDVGRPATPADIDEICGSLPETELGISWGDRPTWKVPRGDKTIDHVRSFDAVLVQQSRLGELDVEELREILTDAWAKRAPRRLVREYLGDA